MKSYGFMDALRSGCAITLNYLGLLLSIGGAILFVAFGLRKGNTMSSVEWVAIAIGMAWGISAALLLAVIFRRRRINE